MLVDYEVNNEIAQKIRAYFILHPEEELHLLGIVKHVHVGGNLNELRQIADELVEQGDLTVKSRYGARYYKLTKR